MNYFVYFLESLQDKKYYIGCTSRNPSERLAEHNSGMVKSTSKRLPFKLVYLEPFKDKKEAFKREWYLKHPKGYQDKLDIISKIKCPGSSVVEQLHGKE